MTPGPTLRLCRRLPRRGGAVALGYHDSTDLVGSAQAVTVSPCPGGISGPWLPPGPAAGRGGPSGAAVVSKSPVAQTRSGWTIIVTVTVSDG